MRKPKITALVAVTFVFAAFTLGFFLGRNRDHDGIYVSVPEQLMAEPSTGPTNIVETTAETEGISFPIDINQAGKEELMALPGIGEILAQRILDYRAEVGSFTSLEELLNVEGIGKKRLEEILDFITIGG